ncbi:hypothetical protein [Oceanobacillus sp. FSL H7-0719]|uniref:hypothetical protein n=1 Tax=Oceanobacillus sp. FSL H7-0719 TaxID=2954507 RepID=UPI0032558676
MKTLEEVIKQKPVYLHNWKHKVDVICSFEDIYMDYDEYVADTPPYNEESWIRDKTEMNEAIEEYKDVNVLFASYGEGNYSGDAWVLFEREGKLYEVNGGHCSCYGLEGQWDEEEVMLKELENRLVNGHFGENDWSGNEFKKELCEFLGIN